MTLTFLKHSFFFVKTLLQYLYIFKLKIKQRANLFNEPKRRYCIILDARNATEKLSVKIIHILMIFFLNQRIFV